VYVLIAREAELRQLRKQNTEFEEQNAILGKHIDNMKSAIDKLESETSQLRASNSALDQHLAHLRLVLTKHFTNISLPGTSAFATYYPALFCHVHLHLPNNLTQHHLPGAHALTK
jgi:thiamine kinase-like enzyme